MRDTSGFSVSIHLHIEIYYRRHVRPTFYYILHFILIIDTNLTPILIVLSFNILYN